MKIKGIVEKSTGSFYRVRSEGDEIYTCTLRGKLRLENSEATNPVAVGDRVWLSYEDGNTLIDEILPRENYIIRKSTHNERKVQILCANVSQAVFIASIDFPFTPLSTIDRFLVSCEAYHIPTFLVFNKTDLLKKEKHKLQLLSFIETYQNAGYEVLAGNIFDHDFLSKFQKKLSNQITFLGGVSGVGKSSLINAIAPVLDLKTGQISAQTNKGKHTTTYAEMFELPFGGFVVDAPGVREFHLADFSAHEVCKYFPEMFQYASQCKFTDCMHLNEPGCAVLAMLKQGKIGQTRYNTYQMMVKEVKSQKMY